MNKKTKKSFKDFVTRPKSNAGVTLPIPEFDGETITILGGDSDVFRIEQDKILSDLRDDNLGDKKPTAEEIYQKEEENRIRQVAVLVVGWSFDEECTRENVEEFLTDAPHVRKFVDLEAGRMSHFLGKK